MGLHVRVQVQGGGHAATLLGVQLVEECLAAGSHVVPPQLIGPLLPDGHGLGGSLLFLTAHRRTGRRSGDLAMKALSCLTLDSILDGGGGRSIIHSRSYLVLWTTELAVRD